MGCTSEDQGDHDTSYYENFVPKADGSDFDNVAVDGEPQTVSMTSKEITRTPSTYGYFTIGINLFVR